MMKIDQEIKDLMFLRNELRAICSKHIMTSDKKLWNDVSDFISDIAEMTGKLKAQKEIREESDNK